ncbi:patatin-like phospholipase family protein [Algoriphagus persicinus]|uniref:patatin-like phospholipase family protein n=1 Tax=Algoriphagus persicinus TaxID=3108754 RepID=UPI002B3E52E7|nr:patatin-like phospholipase family protein [Algoriphagus sp. E1-3-M2]MEB2784393.1 patatin-like phospholipase family protein [Algoriphagus sp. E1-3-M2]
MRDKIWYSFPVQLLLLHLRKNLVLTLIWVVLTGVILEYFGVVLGIPFLFLDPEYLHQVSWVSFFLMGVGFAVLTMAFHMSTYIMDGRHFPFLVIINKPFIHYCVNNGLIPLTFYVTYIIRFIEFQLGNDLSNDWEVLYYFIGFVGGGVVTYSVIFGYFSFTNKDFFILFAGTVDKRLRKVRLTRANVLSQYKDLKTQKYKVLYYLNIHLRPEKVRPDISRFEGTKLLRVFDQNHLNLFIIQIGLILFVLFLGFFKENPYLQLPAAMSATLLLAILIMLVGAVSFWLRRWSTFIVFAFLLLANYFSNFNFLNRPHEAYGLDYSVPPVTYSLAHMDSLLTPELVKKDRDNVLNILHNWKTKFPEEAKPKLVIVAASGGGQRAALWTVKILQSIYGIEKGEVLKHTELFTGASGGVLGEAFFREVYLRSLTDPTVDPMDEKYLDQISADNLNPIIFTLLVNDLLIRNQNFEYNGRKYLKDRGFAFENQLNQNTEGILDKPISAYKAPEFSGSIPLLPVTTLITNDGRKLVISPHSMSFFGTSMLGKFGPDEKKQTIDFLRFFEHHDSKNLRFLSALRMSATFPFITPNIELPTEPVMETMDTGLSDNFGIQDALRFMYVFQSWIYENTGGVVLITIRDSEKITEIAPSFPPRIFEKIFIPLKNIYANWDNVQTIQNEVLFNYMAESMPFALERIEFEYAPEKVQAEELTESQETMQRASLNWRLTAREKKSILESVYTLKNQSSLKRLEELFTKNQPIIEDSVLLKGETGQ